MATQAQLNMLRITMMVCKRVGSTPLTISHRRQVNQSTVSTSGQNRITRVRSGSSTREVTDDYQVWCSSLALKSRGGAMNQTDVEAGREGVGMNLIQCPALDVNGNEFPLAEDDWITMPDGSVQLVKNPDISSEGSFWTFSTSTQR